MAGNEFERALRLMRRRDPQLAEDGFAWLREIAVSHVVAQLHGKDEAFRRWAERGLRLLDTTQSRRVLWQYERNQPPGVASPAGHFRAGP